MIDSTIVGVALGAAIPLLKDFIAGRRAEKIERLKIHDSERLKAYRKALEFASELRFIMRDDNQTKDLTFLNGCSGKLYRVLSNLPYYSPKVREGFLEMETLMCHIMGNIMDGEGNTTLVTGKVPSLIDALRKNILADFRKWD
ncbi:MAG TPA: hypothetical protein VGP73_00895 [Thermoanaerobaculia bacterium]